ncbi:hypothetical protein D3C75_953400 [compost metagenome]
MRGEFRGLDHHPVAGGQGAGESAEDHVARDVPRGDNAHYTQGLILNPGFTGSGLTLFRTHPLGHFGLGLLEGGQRRQHFAAPGESRAAMTEVSCQGVDDFLLVADQ